MYVKKYELFLLQFLVFLRETIRPFFVDPLFYYTKSKLCNFNFILFIWTIELLENFDYYYLKFIQILLKYYLRVHKKSKIYWLSNIISSRVKSVLIEFPKKMALICVLTPPRPQFLSYCYQNWYTQVCLVNSKVQRWSYRDWMTSFQNGLNLIISVLLSPNMVSKIWAMWIL